MALVSSGFWVRVTLVDNGGNATTRSFQMRGADYDTAIADADTILTLIGAASDAVVSAWALEERYTNDAFSYPASGVQVENQALIDIAIADHFDKSATVTIPAPKSTLFVGTAGTNANVVAAVSAVLNYVDMFKSTGVAFISDGEDADFFKKGRRIHRKNVRG